MKVQLGTRLDTGLRQRLRIYAAITGRTVADVVSAALDGYLPPTAALVQLAGQNAPGASTPVNGSSAGADTPTLRSRTPDHR